VRTPTGIARRRFFLREALSLTTCNPDKTQWNPGIRSLTFPGFRSAAFRLH
jgi:hypothetical protein